MHGEKEQKERKRKGEKEKGRETAPVLIYQAEIHWQPQ